MYRMAMTALVLTLSCAAFMVGCDDGRAQPPSPEANAEQKTKEFVQSVLAKERTVGNHSYLPIDMPLITQHEKSWELLELLHSFEEKHPELEVTGWAVEKSGGGRWFDGLWVDHRPKAAPGPEKK